MYIFFIRDLVRWIRYLLNALGFVCRQKQSLFEDQRSVSASGKFVLFLDPYSCFSRITAHSSPSSAKAARMSSLVRSSTVKNFVRCAGLSGALAIGLGVYGAHRMKDDVPDDRKRVRTRLCCASLILSFQTLFSYSNWRKPIICFTQWRCSLHPSLLDP